MTRRRWFLAALAGALSALVWRWWGEGEDDSDELEAGDWYVFGRIP